MELDDHYLHSLIATKVKHRRHHLRLTQSELAKLAGVPVYSIADLENGRMAKQDHVFLMRLAIALQVPISYFTVKELEPRGVIDPAFERLCLNEFEAHVKYLHSQDNAERLEAYREILNSLLS